jgi:hypothetical protein
MKDDLQRHPDAEAPGNGREERVPEDAEAWGRLLEAFRNELPAVPTPPWLETRVMAEIEALPEPGWVDRLGAWLLTPRSLRASPLLVGTLATAALALLLLWNPARPGAPGAVGDDTVVYVQFALDAPDAQSVAVAGDFDGWVGTHTLQDGDGDGVWTGRVPLRPGVHAYMFLVDGGTWLTDPRAERYADDGFGNRNAILAVAAPSA